MSPYIVDWCIFVTWKLKLFSFPLGYIWRTCDDFFTFLFIFFKGELSFVQIWEENIFIQSQLILLYFALLNSNVSITLYSKIKWGKLIPPFFTLAQVMLHLCMLVLMLYWSESVDGVRVWLVWWKHLQPIVQNLRIRVLTE